MSESKKPGPTAEEPESESEGTTRRDFLKTARDVAVTTPAVAVLLSARVGTAAVPICSGDGNQDIGTADGSDGNQSARNDSASDGGDGNDTLPDTVGGGTPDNVDTTLDSDGDGDSGNLARTDGTDTGQDFTDMDGNLGDSQCPPP